ARRVGHSTSLLHGLNQRLRDVRIEVAISQVNGSNLVRSNGERRRLVGRDSVVQCNGGKRRSVVFKYDRTGGRASGRALNGGLDGGFECHRLMESRRVRRTDQDVRSTAGIGQSEYAARIIVESQIGSIIAIEVGDGDV